MRNKLGLALALAIGVIGCAKKNTELMVAVQTDLRVPKDLDAVTVRVLSFGAVQHSDTYVVGPSGLKLPATIGVVPQDADNLRPIDIEIIGHFASRDVVIRKARLTFAKERVGLVRLPLKFSCYEKTNCGAEETCIAGKCEQIPTIEGEALPEYSAEQVFGANSPAEGQLGECWDGDRCLAAAEPLAATQVRCVYDRAGEAGRDPSKPVTVALVKPGSSLGYCSAGVCRVALDLDALEGWDWVDDTRTKIRLAPNVCDRVLTDGFRVEATVACETKLATIPLCEPSGDSGAPPGDASPETTVAPDGTTIEAATDGAALDSAVTTVDAAVDPDTSTAPFDAAATDTATSASDAATGNDSAVAPADTGQANDTFVDDTLVEDTFVEDTFVEDTFVEDTFVEDTFVDDTGDACFPVSCGDLGGACGVQADGCGGQIDCGPCDTEGPDTAAPDTAVVDTSSGG